MGKRIDTDIKKDTQKALIALALLVLTFGILVFVLISFKPESDGKQANTENKEVITTESIYLSEELEDRVYENITTHIFVAKDINKNVEVKLSDGLISNENILKSLNNYVSTLENKIVAIGVIDNKFYIQYNTSKLIDKEQKVVIVSLKNSIKASDWFGLTEAIYNKEDVLASNIYSYNNNDGDIHFIYVVEQ